MGTRGKLSSDVAVCHALFQAMCSSARLGKPALPKECRAGEGPPKGWLGVTKLETGVTRGVGADFVVNELGKTDEKTCFRRRLIESSVMVQQSSLGLRCGHIFNEMGQQDLRVMK